jgi:eukaryotic-like serine/threonine-protein kinase
MNDWQRVQEIFHDAVDLSPEDRGRFLRDCCRGDARMLLEVESLLAADRDSGALIEKVVTNEAASLFDARSLIGERIGIYRIVREIGRGGMGSVYLAMRDDLEYRKEVALKVVKRGMDTAEVLKRFRSERQILANLEHPYIARLLDGGSTVDGVPYFVMEYIQGQPVNTFCRENKLGYKACCELFIRILEAVAHAHRNLVVHRDLKPANILITADGTPKLLDFGVAKLLSGSPEDDHTQTAWMRPFTPRYASPEQVRGLPITTSTDIYSLGAILYELLIGKPAQAIEVHTPAEIERVVCQTEAPRPSVEAHGIPADLDNIVLMALRKEPERRYQSAVQFAEDLRRHLDGRPVIARQDSVRYRATKFILRNLPQVTAAGLITASLVGGLVISLEQTHLARRARSSAEAQRQIAVDQTSRAELAASTASKQKLEADRQRSIAAEQRDEAQHQKAIADQRVKQMMELADRTLFRVHDAIATLPGSLAVRKALLQTTLEYLQDLQKQAPLDDEMREALCAAYYKVAMIQGDPHGASLQDFKGSETNLLKGQELLMPAYNRHPNDTGFMLRLVEIRASLADLMVRSDRLKEGVQMHIDLLPVTHRLYLAKDCKLNCKLQEPVLDGMLAHELTPVDPAVALVYANRAIAIEENLLRLNPQNSTLEQGVSSLRAAAAGIYTQLGELDKANEYYKGSIAVREELLRNDPTNPLIRRNLMLAYGNYAAMLGLSGGSAADEGRMVGEKGVVLAREAVKADANDMTARHDLGVSLSRLGAIEPPGNEIEPSLAELHEAETLLGPIAAANSESAEIAAQLANVLEFEGRREESLGRQSDAMDVYRRSIATLRPFLDHPTQAILSEYVADAERLGPLEASAGQSASFGSAVDLANDALRRVQEFFEHAPKTDPLTILLARAWSGLSLTQAKAGMLSASRQSAVTALGFWHAVEKAAQLTQYRQLIAGLEQVTASQAAK